MAVEFKKSIPLDLRSLGLDEKWLHDRIEDDPSILGLGELEIAGREHRQPMGGSINFLMRDAEAETYYEVEVMLGTSMRAISFEPLNTGTLNDKEGRNSNIVQ